MEFLTEFRDRWRSRKFRNNGHACTSIVVQINTDDEKDGFELFTGTMMYFRVLLYVREFTEQHHFRTSGPGRSLPVDSGCCSADLSLQCHSIRRFPRSVTADRSIQNVWRTRESCHDTSILRKQCHSSPTQSKSGLHDTPPYSRSKTTPTAAVSLRAGRWV